MNLVIIKGNLTRDPELKYTPKGTAITEFGVAINKTWTNDAGEKKEKVTFIDVKFWGKGGEVVAQYFTKGKPILIQGELDVEQWEDKATMQKRSKVVITAQSFEFCGGDKPSTPAPGRDERQQQRPPQRQQAAPQRSQSQEDDWDQNPPF